MAPIDRPGKRTAVMMAPWHQIPIWMRIFRVVAFVGWFVVMGSMLTVGEIETVALWQPNMLDGPHEYPHNIKGTVRYFTDAQERVYRVAKPIMIGSLMISLVLFCFLIRIETEWDERRSRVALGDIVRRMDERGACKESQMDH